MLPIKARRVSRLAAVCLLPLSLLVGCSSWEWDSDHGGKWVPKELPDADRAVEAARQAGKDRECPEQFKAAEALKDEAWAKYHRCLDEESLALAREAASKAAAPCPPRVVAEPRPAPAPPSPAPAPAPTVSLTASPDSVIQGQCASLTWSSSQASSVSIEPGIGRVDSSGSRQVCPASTTQYIATAAGAGGSRTSSTTVVVRPRALDKLTIHVNFDFNKSAVRAADEAELQKAIEFVKKYPGYEVSIEGYTDSIGSEAYNQKLSERRAAAVKAYLESHGAADSRMKASGHGESDPVADNSTAEGRAENRRVEIVILSQ